MSPDDDRDDALLRRLYEPDAAGTDDDAAPDVAPYRRLRGAFAEYARATEVEPPSRGMDELLAAARARVGPRAAVATDTPGAWARLRGWLTAIAAHPALASAAMVVVIASVAGILYVKGRARVAEPEASAPAVAGAPPVTSPPATAPPATAPARDDGFAVQLGSGGEVAPTPLPPTLPTVDPSAPTSSRPAPDPAKAKHAGQGDKADTERGSVAADSPAGPGASAGGADGVLDPDTTLRREVPTTLGQSQIATGNDDVTPRYATPPSSSPPPEAEDQEAAPAAPQEPGPPQAKPTSTAKPKLDVEQVTRQARTAAKSGDCAVVKALAGRVRAADAAFYQRRFAADPDIKKCL